MSALGAAVQSLGTVALLAAAVILAARLHYLTRAHSAPRRRGTGQGHQDGREAA